MSHSRKQQQQTFNTHSRFTAGRASHDTSALCRELNAAGSADTEQTCCCLFFFLFLCFVWVFFFGPTLFYILMCRRLSQWHFSHASAFRPHGRHQYTHLICQPLSTFPSHWLSSALWVCSLSLLRPHPRVTL